MQLPLRLAAVVIVTAALTTAFTRRPPHFDEISVERINVVEPDGQVRLVIANRARSPARMDHGKPFGPPGGDRPGMIFYNDEGTENGGLTFSGRLVDGVPEAVGSLTFDQYGRDQTVALQYVDAGGTRRSGLAVVDYGTGTSTPQLMAERDSLDKLPEGPDRDLALKDWRRRAGGALRLYVGCSRDDGAALVSLHDGEGRTRLRFRVDPLGSARIEFLDEDGAVTRVLEGE